MKLFKDEYLNGLAGVFSCAAFLAYSWSLLVLFWGLSFLLLEWDIINLVVYVAYQFLFALVGSLAVTIFIAVLGLVFPAKYLRQNIAAAGTALVVAFAINSIVYKQRYSVIYWLADMLSINRLTASQIVMSIWVISLLVLPIGLVMVAKSNKVERVLIRFIENLSVLVVPYVILSLLGILVVIFKQAF
jgi:hypothetical protein